MHQCSASIHWEREERGESRGRCLCDDTDPIRSHGKGVEHEAARRQRGIEFARLRLQDEPWIWFLCYTSICYYISVSEGVCVAAFSNGSITCVGLCRFMSLQGYLSVCMCVSKQFESLWLMFACIFLFFALGLNPSGEPCSALFQSRSDPFLPPLPALLSALFSSNNMVKSNTWSVIMWDIFVEPPSQL